MIDINLLTRSEKIKIFISAIFFVASIVLFAYSIQRYQVLTSSRAEEPVVPPKKLEFNQDSNYGTILNVINFTITDITSNDVITKYKTQHQTYPGIVKLLSPRPETIQHANFKQLADIGVMWHFSFNNFSEVRPVIEAYYDLYNRPTMIELTNIEGLNLLQAKALLDEFPYVGFMGQGQQGWQREKAREVLNIAHPPELDAISFSVKGNTAPINTNLKFFFSNFYGAANDLVSGTEPKLNYPANTYLAISNIDIAQHSTSDIARRLGIISNAVVVAAQTNDGLDTTDNAIIKSKPGKAPIIYINAGPYDSMTDVEREFIVQLEKLTDSLPTLVWPKATADNNRVWDNPNVSNADPIMGFIGKYTPVNTTSPVFAGVLINTNNETVDVQLPSFLTVASSTSTTRQSNVTISADNVITFQPHESILFTANLKADTTITPSTTVTGVATPFPTLPAGGEGQLVCDAGDDAYNSNTLRVTNNTNETIDDLTSVTHRCTYIKDKVRKGYYKCETCTDPDEVNNPDCQVGVADPNASIVEFVLAPGESKTITVNANACETIQLDVYNTDENAGDSPLECYNVRSRYTDPAPPARWQGGIAFGINQNSTGYDEATGTCPVPTTPVPTTPVPTTPVPTTPVPTTPVDTETPTPTPTLTPTSTPTPSPSPTPTPTLTPTPTPVPPTATPIPTNTPPQQIAVNQQPPGVTPWAFIFVPIGLLILGLLL